MINTVLFKSMHTVNTLSTIHVIPVKVIPILYDCLVSTMVGVNIYMQRWTYNNTIEEIHILYNFLVSTVAMWTSTCRGENVTGENHLYWTEMCRCLSREFTCTPMVKEIPRQGIVFALPNTQFPEKEGKHSNLERFAHGIRTWLPTVSSETRLTSHSQCPSTSIQTYYTSWWVNEPCHWTLPRHHQPCWKSQCIQSKWNSKEQKIVSWSFSSPHLHSCLSVPSPKNG